ncbi:MAG TPA: nitroreductase, partial [Nitrospiria bacterium]|nr:nitroreductase [Nitrospiria bacterium]
MAAPELDLVLAYHEATKHHLNRYARGPGGLDWANQPDPFRRYDGAPLIPLNHVPAGERPLY